MLSVLHTWLLLFLTSILCNSGCNCFHFTEKKAETGETEKLSYGCTVTSRAGIQAQYFLMPKPKCVITPHSWILPSLQMWLNLANVRDWGKKQAWWYFLGYPAMKGQEYEYSLAGVVSAGVYGWGLSQGTLYSSKHWSHALKSHEGATGLKPWRSHRKGLWD